MVMSERSDTDKDGSGRKQVTGSAGRNVIAVIGVDRYHSWKPLSNAVRDATSALALFERLGFEQITEPLLDDRATGAAFHKLVTEDLMTLGLADSLVVFYAGHGGTRTYDLGDQEIKTGYLIPVDASESLNKVATWIELDGWLRAISLLPARHILVILDACHSGIALGSIIKWRDVSSRDGTPLSTLNARRSRRIITSALHDQVALDSGPVEGHSLFTGCLIEGLTHDLRRGGSRVTTGSEIGLYLQRRVHSYPGSQQTPDFGSFAHDARGEILIPLVSETTNDGDAALRDRRERARRMLFDACDRWIEQERSERRLLDLETVHEILVALENESISIDMIRFIDEGAAYHIDDQTAHIGTVLEYIGQLDAALLDCFRVIIVIHGESYFRGTDDHNYTALSHYVRRGGTLFMTPWVAWETVQRPFAEILPFRHVRSSHNEGITLQSRPAQTQLAQELFPEAFVVEVSYEELSPRPDTTVLLYGDNGTPLYGFCHIEQGECHYLNVCQHHCTRSMKSPLQTVSFSDAMGRIWRWLYGRCWKSPESAARLPLFHFSGHGHGAPDSVVPFEWIHGLPDESDPPPSLIAIPQAAMASKPQPPGRNARCPCNSGKKYKRCCGRKDV